MFKFSLLQRKTSGSLFSLICVFLTFGRMYAQPPASTPPESQKSSASDAPIFLEIWQWGDDESERKKISTVKDGDRIAMETLPDEIQFRFQISVDHDRITYSARSADGKQSMGEGPVDVHEEGVPQSKRLYRYQPSGFFPDPGGYCLQIKGEKNGKVVAQLCANIEFVAPPLPHIPTHHLFNVGSTEALPKPVQLGAHIQLELWQWGEKGAEKILGEIKEGARIPCEMLPKLIQVQFRVSADIDAVEYRIRSTDGVPVTEWDSDKVKTTEAPEHGLFRGGVSGFFPQIGKYSIEVRGKRTGRTVAERCINFEIMKGAPPPFRTTYLVGKKDWKGNVITSSKPMVLGPLNETPLLRDNDYLFEPQHAYQVINWERFPPFRLPARFPVVYGSRRFTDEDKFGGPLNRGFNSLAVISSDQDNLRISERTWFHSPDNQVQIINELLKSDPVKYHDLKAYAEHRSAFVSPENAQLLGKLSYERWGAGGYGPYDAGIYGWDEEQMYPDLAAKLLKEHPDQMPERFQKLKERADAGDPATLAFLQRAYTKAWGDFVANTYKGARESAASRDRTFKVWHYGSKTTGEELFLYKDGAAINPATDKFKYEELGTLHEWFSEGIQSILMLRNTPDRLTSFTRISISISYSLNFRRSMNATKMATCWTEINAANFEEMSSKKRCMPVR